MRASLLASLSLEDTLLMKQSVFIVALCCCLAAACVQAISDVEEDTYLNTIGLLTKYGYPVEIHSVTTEDGYILELHRVPYGKKSPAAPDKPVVFLQHGNLCSSSDWVIMGTEKGLAYILADAGYDVWMGNARGNTYSRKHLTLDPDDQEVGDFWKFDWNEMGLYDLPAVIDYVLAQTNQPNLFYIGHSMGTSMFFVLVSEKPEYNAKIRCMFSLSPIAYLGYAYNPMLRSLAFADLVTTEWYIQQIGAYEYQPSTEFQAAMGYEQCRDEAPNQSMCENMLFIGAGWDSEQLNSTMLPVIYGHTPAGASSRQLWHFAQEVTSFRFHKYDWGSVENLNIYGQTLPPNYKTDLITCPMSLHYSDNDWFANTIDVDTFASKLPNLVGKFKVPFAKFNHLDFLWAIDVKTLVYDKILSLMTRF